MKKVILGITFIGLLAFVLPAQVNAADYPCQTAVIRCGCDGTTHLVIVCQDEDITVWMELLCPHNCYTD